ncbi:MAG: hypothetical protein RR278_05535 [Mucinivorans sp.]
MKKIITTLLSVLVVTAAFSQELKDIAKERKEIIKLSKTELNAKSTKDARKEASKLKKEGWTTTPGALPIDNQLDKSYLMQYEFDENMFPKYIMAEAMSIGENYDGARVQATELAKLNLAGQMQSEITALVENTVANSQLTADEAATVTKSITASKNTISQSLGRVIPVVEVYRTLKNKNKEVLVRLAYNSEMAKNVVKKAVRKDLETKGEELHGKLDKLLNW